MFDKLWVPAVGSVAMLGNKAMFSGFTNLFQLLSEPDAQKGAAAKRLHKAGFKVKQGKSRRDVLAEKVAGVEQQAFSQTLNMVDVVMAATDQVVLAGDCLLAGKFRIMVQGDTPALYSDGRMVTMVVEVGKGRTAP